MCSLLCQQWKAVLLSLEDAGKEVLPSACCAWHSAVCVSWLKPCSCLSCLLTSGACNPDLQEEPTLRFSLHLCGFPGRIPGGCVCTSCTYLGPQRTPQVLDSLGKKESDGNPHFQRLLSQKVSDKETKGQRQLHRGMHGAAQPVGR